MDFAIYQQQADVTSGFSGQPTIERLTVAALGLVGEAGEVAELIKKALGHGHPLDTDKLGEEMGDLLWYVAETASACALDLDEVAIGIYPPPADGVVDMQWLTVWGLSLPGQVALIAEHVSNHLADPKNFDIVEVYIEETLAETLSQLMLLAECAGLSLFGIAERNLSKLAARYPNGFDPARSRERYETL